MSMQFLYEAVQQRKRPEDVADAILRVLGPVLDRGDHAILYVVARGALRHRLGAYTSMAQDFARPKVDFDRQFAKAAALFGVAPPQASDPETVEAFVRQLSVRIHKAFGRNSPLSDRLDRHSRRELGIEDTRRTYNRKFRLLASMERKLLSHAHELRFYELTRIGRSGLASALGFEELARDAETACFVAYYTSRCNLRSEFTVSGQQRPFDTVAATLFARCERNPATNWLAIAHVFPTPGVLARLRDDDKGQLLSKWTVLLREIAGSLEETWHRSRFDRRTMIVKRGDDSTTWNLLARAWNTARGHWMALVSALGMSDLFAHFLPGKAMQLMAADVAAWHRSIGRSLHPDTFVWSSVPPPWDVLEGRARLTRAAIEEACARYGVDPARAGWTEPPKRDGIVAFRPTPELVHGVAIASAHVATILKKAGFFSGKPPKTLPSSEDEMEVS